MKREQISQIVIAETKAINKTLRRLGVDAGTAPNLAMVCGGSHIVYQVRLGQRETVQRVLSRLPEIDESLYHLRRAPVQSRPWLRPLAIEVPHPQPYPLRLQSGLPALAPHTMLAGRRYDVDGPFDIVLDLDGQPHTLIAGITGAGKSIALQMLLLSLCANTSPADLEIVVIDLKNEEGADLAHLPHVRQVAVTAADAQSVIERVHEIKEQRVQAGRWTGSRLLLVIDELAEVYRAWPRCETPLGSIASIGRSKGINIIAATQKPNKDAVGSILKANFTQRLIGAVGDTNESYYASGRRQLEAHLLPGRGAFLYVGGGSEAARFQAYYLTPGQIVAHTRKIRAHWYGASKPTSQIETHPMPDAQPQSTQDDDTVVAAIAGYRSSSLSTADLRSIAHFVASHADRVSSGDWSKAELIRQAYGAGLISSAVTGGRNANLFRDALEAAERATSSATSSATEALPPEVAHRPRLGSSSAARMMN